MKKKKINKSDWHTQSDAHKMKLKNDYVRKKLHTPAPSFHLFFNVALFTLANIMSVWKPIHLLLKFNKLFGHSMDVSRTYSTVMNLLRTGWLTLIWFGNWSEDLIMHAQRHSLMDLLGCLWDAIECLYCMIFIFTITKPIEFFLILCRVFLLFRHHILKQYFIFYQCIFFNALMKYKICAPNYTWLNIKII